MSVRDRPRQNDSTSQFDLKPRCFLYGLTAAEALIRGLTSSSCISQDSAGTSGTDKWGGQPENLFSRYPLRRSCPVPFSSFSWPGGGRICDGRGAVVLLECAFDGGEVRLFHGVTTWMAPSAVLLVTRMLIFDRTLDLSATVSEPRRTFLAQRELPLTDVKAFCPLPGVGGLGSCPDAAPAEYQRAIPLSSRVGWRLSFRPCSRSDSVRSVRRGPLEVDVSVAVAADLFGTSAAKGARLQ